MTDDVLSAYMDAYRAEHSARSLDRPALRARVIAAAGRRRVRRAERVRLLLPFAASFFGSLAFAASPPVRERVRDAFSFVRSGETARTAPRPLRPPRNGPAPATPPSPAVVAAPAALAVATSAPPARAVASFPAAAVPARGRARAPAVSAPVAPSAAAPALPSSASFDVEPAAARPTPVANADLALYRRAHELHFGGGDGARALAAWDAYLRAFPRGTFAPEARLNRAVCLAKLGRKAEAESVLVDIERGRFGKDGRRQARKILGALEDGD